MKIVSFTLVLLTISGVDCYYLYDLFGIIDLKAIPGVTEVTGPKAGNNAYNLAPGTGAISTDSIYYAYIANSIVNSNDVTFYTYFKFKETKILPGKKVYYTFFSLQDKNSATPQFSIRLGYQNVANENEDVVNTDYKKTLFIDYQVDSYLVPTSVPVNKLIKADTWQMIMVRIQDNHYSVKIDCNEVTEGPLAGGKIKPFPYGGVLTITQGITKNSEVDGRFIGALYQPTILVGAGPYEYFDPCNKDNKEQIVPSEPRPDQFDRTNSNKFIKLSSTNISPVRIFCKDKEGVDRYSGTSWSFSSENGCWTYTCKVEELWFECENCSGRNNGWLSSLVENILNCLCSKNGVVHSKYTCRYCKDPSTNKEYKNADVWKRPTDACLEYECEAYPGLSIYDTDLSQGCTNPLNCDKWGNQGDEKPAGQCCDKCWSDSCKDGRVYYEGCDRPCSGGINFECPQKKRGCWCPEGQALNDDGECIPASDCVCKSGRKIYNPGQAVIRSQCETCVCAMGELICFKSCSY